MHCQSIFFSYWCYSCIRLSFAFQKDSFRQLVIRLEMKTIWKQIDDASTNQKERLAALINKDDHKDN